MPRETHAELFTAILDRLDRGPNGDFPADEGGHASAAPILPERARQSKDWLLQLLGSISETRSHDSETPSQDAESERQTGYDLDVDFLEAVTVNEQEAIAIELGLDEKLSPLQLKRLRRAFALANHPDRIDPSRRAYATRRMTIANMLIDQRLKIKGKIH